jgi:hypothetical protein
MGDIIDPRTIYDFQSTTFSGYTRAQVTKSLGDSIRDSNADYSCLWALEMLCSGQVHSLWDIVFDSCMRYINRSSPNSILYLTKVYEKFAEIQSNYPIPEITSIRNNDQARNIVCDIVASLSLCRKSILPKLPKITVERDFNTQTMRDNLRAPSANFARHIMRPQDLMDLHIPLNELYYSLTPEIRDFNRALYWVSWILKYSKLYQRKQKVKSICHTRPNTYIPNRHCNLPIWMIWELINDISSKSPQSTILNPYIDALFKIYCLRWSQGVQKSKLSCIICAIQFICESKILDIHYNPPSTHIVLQNIPAWIDLIQPRNTFPI